MMVGQMPMGRLTAKLLDAMEIAFFSPAPSQAEETIERAWGQAAKEGKPVAVLLDLEFWRGK